MVNVPHNDSEHADDSPRGGGDFVKRLRKLTREWLVRSMDRHFIPDHPFELDNVQEASALDKVASAFEGEIIAGNTPRIEDYLPPKDHLNDAYLFELLSVELDYRVKNGESPTRNDYTVRFQRQFNVVGAVFDYRSMR